MSETLPEQKIVATLADGTQKTFLPGANAGDEPATSKLQFFYIDGTELDARSPAADGTRAGESRRPNHAGVGHDAAGVQRGFR